MPIFMDFHDMPDGVSAKHVAEMHQADLKIEHKYNCRGLTYWCDERRQTAFCLIEAPNKQAIIDLHEQAHGDVPQRIIQVNDTIVESFLGRIVDPEKSQDTTLNIINDPAFRALMVVRFTKNQLRHKDVNTLQAAIRGYKKSIVSITQANHGRIVQQEGNQFLMSFKNVSQAITSACNIQELYNCVITPDISFNIGISAGLPVTKKDGLFEDTIKRAQYLCNQVKGSISISQEVYGLYESENPKLPPKDQNIYVLSAIDQEFLTNLMDFTEQHWQDANTVVSDFAAHLGYSKSKLYRSITAVLGKSPNVFLKEYRLTKALALLDKQQANISQIAYQTGFSSPAYFATCFNQVYGMLPSVYVKQLR